MEPLKILLLVGWAGIELTKEVIKKRNLDKQEKLAKSVKTKVSENISN